MLKENVPVAEAEKMVASGARILEHKRDSEDRHVCTVEVAEAEAAPVEEEAPKKRGRPPKASKG